MKSTHTSLQNRQVWSDSSRTRRSGRLTVTEKKTRCLEIDVERIGRPANVDIRTTQSSINFQSAANSANPAHPVTLSRHLKVQSKPRQATAAATHRNIPLPPISGSRNSCCKVERTAAVPLHRKGLAFAIGHNYQLPISRAMQANPVLHMLISQCGIANQVCNKSNKISGALAGGNKTIQDSATCSRLIKKTLHVQPAAALDLTIGQKKNDAADPSANDSSMMIPARVKHDASLCEARRQRDFCSDDSAIETEYQDSEDQGCAESLSEEDEEYYTDEKITEWVLKVNSSLFSMGNDELSCSKPAEEQDVATIKIIYSGDFDIL